MKGYSHLNLSRTPARSQLHRLVRRSVQLFTAMDKISEQVDDRTNQKQQRYMLNDRAEVDSAKIRGRKGETRKPNQRSCANRDRDQEGSYCMRGENARLEVKRKKRRRNPREGAGEEAKTQRKPDACSRGTVQDQSFLLEGKKTKSSAAPQPSPAKREQESD